MEMSNGWPDVVVTGVAMTTGLAATTDDTWKALQRGESGVRRLGEGLRADVELPTRIGADLREDVDVSLNRVELRRLSYPQRLALVVSRRAWEHAGNPEVDTARLAVSIGFGFGTTEEVVLAYDDMRERGMRAVSPLHVQMFMPNGPAATVGLEHHAKAGVTAPMLGDASGAAAVALAYQQLILGDADIAICGGVESKIEQVPIATFAQMDGMLALGDDDPPSACRPFDRDRTGMVFGEGGALLVVETEQHAKARGANILARLLGVASNSDAYDPVVNAPDAEQAAEVITRVIERAGLRPDEVGYVNAHATGTVSGDLAEATALRKAFGAAQPAVYASKAALGHSFGAAGAIEAGLTVLSLRDGVIPPTLNFEHLDPAMDIDVVAGEPRSGDYRYGVSTSFGFGGHNVALLLGKY